MRIRYWSSDVCSYDLTIKVGLEHGGGLMIGSAVVIDQCHQRSEVELREQRASIAPVEDAAVEVTAVMVEGHLQETGAHLRGLPRCGTLSRPVDRKSVV